MSKYLVEGAWHKSQGLEELSGPHEASHVGQGRSDTCALSVLGFREGNQSMQG